MPLHTISEDMEIDLHDDPNRAGPAFQYQTPWAAFAGGGSTSGGSADSSSERSSSPAPTLQSMTDSMYDGLFDEKHGRRVNSTCPTYPLAADQPEVDRMDQEHSLYKFLFKRTFGDELWVGPTELVNALLEPDDFEEKRILDLGTGSAAWAIDMAKRWEKADVVGIDVAPLQPEADLLPTNCRLEMDDLNLSMDHYYNTVHLVHVRLLSSGIRDYPGFIDHVARCLRLGGLCYFCETDFKPYYDRDVNSVYQVRARKKAQGGGDAPRLRDSATAMMLQTIMDAQHRKLSHIDAAANLRRWVEEHRMLEEVAYHDLWLPLMQRFPDDGPNGWGTFNNKIARSVSKDFAVYVDSFTPTLLDTFKQEDIDVLKNAALEEIKNRQRQVYVRVVVMVARRKENVPIVGMEG